MTRRTRLAIIVTPLVPRGGAYDILKNWLEVIDKQRFEVIVLYFCHQEHASAARISLGAVKNIRPIVLRSMRWRYFLFIPTVFEVARLLRRYEIDVVHTMFIQSDIIGAMGGRLARVNGVISSVVGKLIIPRGLTRIKSLYYKVAYYGVERWIDRILAISGETRREICTELGVRPEKVEILYCGIDVNRLRPLRRAQLFNGRRRVIGAAAELIPEKGMIFFIRAAEILMNEFPDTDFIIGGEGPDRANLEAYIKNSPLQSRMRLLGWVNDMSAFFRNLDVFVFPSLPNYDGLPRVVLEAWSAGVPVVATRAAGVVEIVRDCENGILVQPHDAEALANGIRKLLSNGELAENVRAEGSRNVECYSREAEVTRLESIYASYSERSRR